MPALPNYLSTWPRFCLLLTLICLPVATLLSAVKPWSAYLLPSLPAQRHLHLLPALDPYTHCGPSYDARRHLTQPAVEPLALTHCCTPTTVNSGNLWSHSHGAPEEELSGRPSSTVGLIHQVRDTTILAFALSQTFRKISHSVHVCLTLLQLNPTCWHSNALLKLQYHSLITATQNKN